MSTREHYLYETTGNGWGVTLISPDGETVWLQDDDASAFLEEVEQLDNVWESNNWETPNPDCFPTYEHHLDVLIDPYFG